MLTHTDGFVHSSEAEQGPPMGDLLKGLHSSSSSTVPNGHSQTSLTHCELPLQSPELSAQDPPIGA